MSWSTQLDRRGGRGAGAGAATGLSPVGSATWSKDDLSPLSTSAARSCEETALAPVWQQLDALEEKFAAHVARSQEQREQSEKAVESLLKPLEDKVVALEGLYPLIGGLLAELRGGASGLEAAISVQSERADASEARSRLWRKVLEDELNAQILEVRQVVTQIVAMLPRQKKLRDGSSPVTRQELAEVATVWSQQLAALEESVAATTSPERGPGIAAVAESLRRELHGLSEVKLVWSRQLAALEESVAAATSPERRSEITAVAESLRRELHRLSEAKGGSPGGHGSPLAELERASARHQKSLSELEERAARSERALQDAQAVLRRLQEHPGCAQALGTGLGVFPAQQNEPHAQQEVSHGAGQGGLEVWAAIEELSKQIVATTATAKPLGGRAVESGCQDDAMEGGPAQLRGIVDVGDCRKQLGMLSSEVARVSGSFTQLGQRVEVCEGELRLRR